MVMVAAGSELLRRHVRSKITASKSEKSVTDVSWTPGWWFLGGSGKAFFAFSVTEQLHNAEKLSVSACLVRLISCCEFSYVLFDLGEGKIWLGAPTQYVGLSNWPPRSHCLLWSSIRIISKSWSRPETTRSPSYFWGVQHWRETSPGSFSK